MSILFRHRYKIFLACLLIVILVIPVIYEVLEEFSPSRGKLLSWAGGIVVLLAATTVVSGKRRARIIAVAFVIPSLAIEIAATYLFPFELLILHYALRFCFILFIVTEMLGQLFRICNVTYDTVCASLCIYLLLGLMWENVYAIMDIAKPGSIRSVIHTTVDAAVYDITAPWHGLFRLRYFSFATLTSVGYGDIVPASTLARMCAITESLIGQIYLLVMVSRLVGLQVSQAAQGNSNNKPS